MVEKKPSVHVTQEGLFKVLKEMGFTFPSEGLKQKFLKRLSDYQVQRHLLVAPTKASAAKINGKKLNDQEAQKSFAILIKLRNLSHSNLRIIKPGQPGWIDVIDASTAAKLFTERFEISDEAEGHKTFYKLCIDSLGANFTIRAIAGCYDKVCAKFQEDVDIYQCKDLKMVRLMMDKYIQLSKMNKQTAEKLTDQKIHFVRCFNLTIELEVNPIKFLEIQFKQLEWSGSIPTPKQLYGEQAYNRYISYKPEESTVVLNQNKTEKQLAYERMLNRK